MITLTIEGREYKAPADWSEITLQQFINVCAIAVPKKLIELYEASAALNDEDPALKARNDARYEAASEDITEWDLIRRFPAYYGRVMMALTDIPESVMRRIHHAPRSAFFNQHVRYIVLSTFMNVPVTIDPDVGIIAYEVPSKESFELGGRTYFFPKSLNIIGEDIPLANEKAITFAEAADIELAFSQLSKGGADSIPLFCAVYCREQGEEYDEHTVLIRAEAFRALTMDNVWQVFFCISALSKKYEISTRGYLRGVARLMRESLPEVV